MQTHLLRMATARGIGHRTWEGLRLGPDTGKVSYGVSQTQPPLPGHWFMWYFHKHPGGTGGRGRETYKAEIRERVMHLIAHQAE
jgi:hypothetical protein